VAQAVESLLCKSEALGSNPSLMKTNKKPKTPQKTKKRERKEKEKSKQASKETKLSKKQTCRLSGRAL
jgi:hypothetical protein